MDKLVNFEFWYGGSFDWGPIIQYVGGQCKIFENIDVSTVCINSSKDISVEVGESSEAKYWFICPNKTLQNGLTNIVEDGDIVMMLKAYASLDNVVLYLENVYIPFIQFDTRENLDYEKRIVESEFNNDDVNLDDEEHILEDENEVGAEHDSDAPSSVLGDMEGTRDEDVQSSINDTMTRRE
ncbi:hypothetical protein LIER_15042 [Lithospermum erythrorhizon]|uniref:PB1-like domain-containing protein n=1 Tax=Lithospermum erythrorhizon TaxID=34254 RepID=A0AAV3Q1F3_LITER